MIAPYNTGNTTTAAAEAAAAPTPDPILTQTAADAIVNALAELRALDRRLADVEYDVAGAARWNARTRAAVRVRQSGDTARDVLFAVLSTAAAYGLCPVAAAAIEENRRRQADEVSS